MYMKTSLFTVIDQFHSSNYHWWIQGKGTHPHAPFLDCKTVVFFSKPVKKTVKRGVKLVFRPN